MGINPTFYSTSCNITRPSQYHFLCLSRVNKLLILLGKGDMVLWLSTLWREDSRVSLSCVAWNGGPPFLRWLGVHRLRRDRCEFNFLHLRSRVVLLFRVLFPGLPVPVPCLHILVFTPVFPVTYTFHLEIHTNQCDNEVVVSINSNAQAINNCVIESYLKLTISNFLSR